MDKTTDSVTRLASALADAAPNSRVTVLAADLRELLNRIETLEGGYDAALEHINQLEERIALLEAPDFRSLDAWLK